MASRAIRGLEPIEDDRGTTKRSDRTTRARKGSAGVSFQPKMSVYSVTGTENEFDMNGKNSYINSSTSC